MNWFTPKCPVEADDKLWIEESFIWLIEEFGGEALRTLKVILPTEEFFPDPYSGDEDEVRMLVDRVCGYMEVDPGRIEVEFYSEQPGELRQHLPLMEFSHSGTAGHYRKRRDKFIISIEASEVDNPMSLVATVAHELGHVLLLGGGRISASDADHEPLTDLLTVYRGMGVFTGNSVFRFTQWTNAFSEGWQTERRGYLTEEMLGYALALFAWMRGESQPAWSKFLNGNVSAHFKSAHKFLSKTGDTLLKDYRSESLT